MKLQVFFGIDRTIHNIKNGVKHDFFTDEELIVRSIKSVEQIRDAKACCGLDADLYLHNLKRLREVEHVEVIKLMSDIKYRVEGTRLGVQRIYIGNYEVSCVLKDYFKDQIKVKFLKTINNKKN